MDSLQDGRYELRDVLGRGGMATVYRAFDRRLQVDRAIKVLADNLASRPKLRERFESEARTMARLHHPNLVTVMDVGQEGERFYMVMELVDGGSLQDRIKALGALSPRQSSEVIQGTLAALFLAHSKGVVHRDIKPHNILLTAEGVPKLTDFGIAQIQAVDTMTKTGAVMGTLAYMAPEQQFNAKGVDARADIYAIGATLCAIATGAEPTGTLYVQEAHAQTLAGVAEPLAEVIKRACRYSPDDRYSTAEEMRSALEALHDQLPDDTDATPLGTPLPQLNKGVWSPTLQPASQGTVEDSSDTWSGEGMFVERQSPSSAAAQELAADKRSRDTISFGDVDEVEDLIDPFISQSEAPEPVVARVPPAPEDDAGATAWEAEVAAGQRKRRLGVVALLGVAVAAIGVGAWAPWGSPAAPIGDPSGTTTPAAPQPDPAVTAALTPSAPPEAEPEPTPTEPEPVDSLPAAPSKASVAKEQPKVTPKAGPKADASTQPTEAGPAPALHRPATGIRPGIARPGAVAKGSTPAATQPTAEPAAEPAPEAAASGKLMVNSLPWSQITLDGADQGATDWSGTLDAGRHNLVLRTSDGRVHRATLTVPADGTVRYCWDFAEGAVCSR